MIVYLKYDINTTSKLFLKHHLSTLKIDFTISNTNEIEFSEHLTLDSKLKLQELLAQFQIEIVNDTNLDTIQRIKMCIDEMLKDKEAVKVTASHYLADKLNYSYAYLSNLFSEATHSSIENYIILRKVDLVKEFLLNTNLTLTEIAYELNYSSVAHLSGQFKKTTGLTTSAFKRIVEKRKQYLTTIVND
ncbi:AraC family transcriptional regulator [Tenacibaculum sp. IB213877]|uniref:helix-turn-helix domain-containing protein n=1 Tax=Tenacibaculum sp. IB213877 TaxID=3097351 RepID=UPI002A59AD71|nr:AraC family transcriptional regulator [Tenacibaculum sp. IB213877]MDY0780120.1 AraC family transcriptional regulator [Tenacibaculum sp. IB213877]